jgi:MFS family permease
LDAGGELRGGDSLSRRGTWGVAVLCLAIFFTDAANSSTIPTFPFYSSGLGASVAMIGLLASASGISTMLMSIPLGHVSDRIGRKKVMLLGVACFIAGPMVYSLSTEPLHLLPAQVVLGIAKASTFSIGFVFISELAPPRRGNLAQGLYLTSMGTGFTLGPLAGGLTAKVWGYSASFYLSSGFALCALALLLLLPEMKGDGPGEPRREGVFHGFMEVIRDPRIVAAGTANFFNSMLYSAIMVYFPLYGRDVGLDESQVGMGLAVRGMVSTATRLPTGVAAIRIGALRLMALGLGVSALTVMALPSFEGLILISAVLGVQGIAYGIYLTSGNIYVTEEAPEGMKGAAIGAYATFSNLSGVFSPILLGAISERWDIRLSLRVAAALAIMGLIITMFVSRRKSTPLDPLNTP